jgi:hypothetical protein
VITRVSAEVSKRAGRICCPPDARGTSNGPVAYSQRDKGSVYRRAKEIRSINEDVARLRSARAAAEALGRFPKNLPGSATAAGGEIVAG